MVLEEGDEWICARFTALSKFLIVATGVDGSVRPYVAKCC
jgi:hypothetical protein